VECETSLCPCSRVQQCSSEHRWTLEHGLCLGDVQNSFITVGYSPRVSKLLGTYHLCSQKTFSIYVIKRIEIQYITCEMCYINGLPGYIKKCPIIILSFSAGVFIHAFIIDFLIHSALTDSIHL